MSVFMSVFIPSPANLSLAGLGIKVVVKDKRLEKRPSSSSSALSDHVRPWSTTRAVLVCESSSGLLRYAFSLCEGDESMEMVEGRGVNKAARLIPELAAQCVTASWTPERAVARTRTAGQKDMDCSVCSPDIVHI